MTARPVVDEHGRSCAFCGACERHPGPDGERCWDSDNGRHLWNRAAGPLSGSPAHSDHVHSAATDTPLNTQLRPNHSNLQGDS